MDKCQRPELCSACGKPAQPKFHRRSENTPQPWRFCACPDGGYFPTRDGLDIQLTSAPTRAQEGTS